MKHDPQELARLLREAIVRPEDVPGPDSPEAQRVLRAVKNQRTRRTHIRRVVPILAILMVAAGGVYLASLRQPQTIVCFSAADLDANRLAPSPDQGMGLEACHSAWQTGQLANADVPPGTIPELVGCESPTGSLWVFPGSHPNVCAGLGLNPADPNETTLPISSLSDRLGRDLNPPACVPIEAAIVIVDDALRELGFAEWTITPQPEPPDRPCASFGIDAEDATIYLVPIPRSSPP